MKPEESAILLLVRSLPIVERAPGSDQVCQLDSEAPGGRKRVSLAGTSVSRSVAWREMPVEEARANRR